jgi:5'-nucleotidase / UDP-sugar diphosphatase
LKKQQKIIALLLLLVTISSFTARAGEKLTILHWNDFHSFNIPYETRLNDSLKTKIGGYATLSGYIKQVKKYKKNVALVHAGDDFQGTPISTITRGMSQIKILNLIIPDVFALGNHEFDYGREMLAKQIMLAKFPVISANIFDKKAGKLFIRPYEIKRYGNLVVGYIGLMTPILNQLTLLENINGLKILDPAKTVNKYVTQLRDSVDLIIVVSHMGVEHDEELAAKITGAHIIIGGHSHTLLFKPKVVNNVYICQAGSRGKYMGKIDLEFDTKEKRIDKFNSELVPMLTEKIAEDLVVAEVVDSLEQIVTAELDNVIGELEYDWKKNKRFESNIGNWQTDVIREFAGTDIAFQNSAGIRKNLCAGKITVRDIWEISPFANNFGIFELTGEELKKALERNVSGEGEHLQVSGLKFKYNPNNPVGERVLEVSVNGIELNPAKRYSVCTNNFVIGIFYNTFHTSPEGKEIRWLQGIDRNVFIQAVKKQKKISSKIEGRMVAIE